MSKVTQIKCLNHKQMILIELRPRKVIGSQSRGIDKLLTHFYSFNSSDNQKFDGAALYLRAERISDLSNPFMITGVRFGGMNQKSRNRIQNVYPRGVFYRLEANTVIGIGMVTM